MSMRGLNVDGFWHEEGEEWKEEERRWARWEEAVLVRKHGGVLKSIGPSWTMAAFSVGP
jgi:hypothetical protein